MSSQFFDEIVRNNPLTFRQITINQIPPEEERMLTNIRDWFYRKFTVDTVQSQFRLDENGHIPELALLEHSNQAPLDASFALDEFIDFSMDLDPPPVPEPPETNPFKIFIKNTLNKTPVDSVTKDHVEDHINAVLDKIEREIYGPNLVHFREQVVAVYRIIQNNAEEIDDYTVGKCIIDYKYKSSHAKPYDNKTFPFAHQLKPIVHVLLSLYSLRIYITKHPLGEAAEAVEQAFERFIAALHDQPEFRERFDDYIVAEFNLMVNTIKNDVHLKTDPDLKMIVRSVLPEFSKSKPCALHPVDVRLATEAHQFEFPAKYRVPFDALLMGSNPRRFITSRGWRYPESPSKTFNTWVQQTRK